MMKHLIFSLIIHLTTLMVSSQNMNAKEEHPIDIRCEKCHALDSNQTTAGMMRCEAIARDEWEQLMNKYYKLLMNTLPEEEKEKLKEAQVSWVTYCEKERAFSGTMYYNMEGHEWRIAAVGRSCNIVRERALELQTYYKMFTFDK